MSEEPLFKYATALPLEGRTMCEVGLILKHGVLVSSSRLGEVSRHMMHNHVGKVLEGLDPDVLPLPVDPAPAEEARILQALRGGATPSHIARDFGRSLRVAGRAAWLFLLVTVVNFLNLGLSAANTLDAAQGPRDVSEAQHHALAYLREQVDNFLEGIPERVPQINWASAAKSTRADYRGEMLLKGVPVSWAQVEPGLPPEGLAGSIAAASLASDEMRPWILDPSLSVKPFAQWPRRFRRSYVRCKPGELPGLIRGLFRHKVINFLSDDELVYDSTGRPLTNGLFGVPKGDITAKDYDPDTAVLRLIISLVPSNEVQNVILGEIRSLPVFTQWAVIELLEREYFVFSAEDMKAAFYLFGLPAEWWPYFVLNCRVSEDLAAELGLPAGKRWPCVVLIPMGWVSATGVMQHLHNQLVRLAKARVPRSLRLPQLSRGEQPEGLAADLRFREFLETYLDDYAQAECALGGELASFAEETSPMHDAVREVFQEWGVATSGEKRAIRVPTALSRGAALCGRLGRARPSNDKILKGVSVVWHLIRSPFIVPEHALSAGGLWVFMLQFRRPAFCALLHFWDVLSKDTNYAERWHVVTEELLAVVLLLPLLHIDFRLPASGVVSCSDASERGAGVVVSNCLSSCGTEALMRRLAAVPNIFRHRIGLMESCAGIGGARRGFELLGIVPAIYLVSEISEDAVRVLVHQWPDTIWLGKMEDVTSEALRPYASGCPLLRAFFHFAGTPCPGFCRWNPFAEGKQYDESARLLEEFKRVSDVCKRVFSSCPVFDCEENVASMSQESCDWISEKVGRRPYCLDMSDLVEQRRRRYFWPNWEVHERSTVKLEDRGHYVAVGLRPASRLPTSAWIKPGWHVSPKLEAFPTLTRPCPVKTPRWRTPGVDKASRQALVAWRRDDHRRPPLHYEARMQLHKKASGKVRFKSVEENERIHFFETDHTYFCWPSKWRRQDPVGFSDARGKLLGNIYFPGHIAFLVGDCLYGLGLLEEPLDVTQLAHRRVRLQVIGQDHGGYDQLDAASVGHEEAMMKMVRWLFLQQSYRGDVRTLMGCPHVKQVWQEIPATWFRWRVALSIPWRLSGDHINVCEARGRCLAVRLRARRRRLQRARYLHLLDSQVNLYQAARGRTGSLKMAHVLRKTCATLLATGLRDINGYTRSSANPADKASRDLAGWKRHQRQHRASKATTSQARSGRREEAWPGAA